MSMNSRCTSATNGFVNSVENLWISRFRGRTRCQKPSIIVSRCVLVVPIPKRMSNLPTLSATPEKAIGLPLQNVIEHLDKAAQV